MDDARYLAGPKEIGHVLGVSPNTVNVWQHRDTTVSPPFPPPVAKLAGCSVWDIRVVIAWADASGRTVKVRDYVAPGSATRQLEA